MKKIYKIYGMHCASCALKIEEVAKKTEGISSVSVNFPAEKLFVELGDNKIDENKIQEIVSSAGEYKIEEVEEFGEHSKKKMTHEMMKGVGGMNDMEEMGDMDMSGGHHNHKITSLLKKKLIVGVILAVLVFFGSMGEMFSFVPAILKNYFVLLILTTPVQFWVGSQFYSGLKLLFKYRTANMDTLISVGTLSAYVYSAVVAFAPELFAVGGIMPSVYFDTSAMIIVLILLGRYFEELAKGRASDAIKKLMGLQPKTARVVKDDVEQEISISDVQIGDLIIVRSGEKIPVDGVIVEGESEIDESMITGESMPVSKKIDDKVIGSTINKFGAFTFRAEKIGKDTVLAQIVKMVEEAQGSKAPIQRLADLVASYFVPSVFVVAITTFITWFILGPTSSISFAVINFVAVLIIACPCALGLATPIAIMVGSGTAAKKGILIKDASSLEIANKIDTVVLDKTGTLTQGKPDITDVIEISSDKFQMTNEDQISNGQKTILQIAGSLAKNSLHPLSKAVVKKAEVDRLEFLKVNNFNEIRGKGIKGDLRFKNQELKILLGNRKLMEENNVKVDEDAKNIIEQLENQGKTVLLLATKSLIHNSSFVIHGLIALADTIKEESKSVVKKLQDIGISVWMITGDNKQTAKAIGDQVGISENNIFAEVLPNQKLEKVKELQGQGKKVAMVGDGINDAPALTQADIGIAMGEGTDVAMESAGITLMRGDLNLIPGTIELSKRTIRIIKQNLFWAFFYNVAFIPVAAGALYPAFGILLNPIFAAVAMSFSSLSVIFNSLRLQK
ncbi:MAG: copper-translocating P-type ATPase [Candidatus Levybacteria bacterium CG10_big_fil_rev_8_21_14_0_10_36_7]|nr:MAG: copper-translocating P-type ATPase [Candidatus Levybacteria bacterium CG10_big_fil_rev_8_21_14_0_10_36_7]